MIRQQRFTVHARRLQAAGVAVAALLAVVLCSLALLRGEAGTAAAPAVPEEAARPQAVQTAGEGQRPLPRSRPTRVSIPKLKKEVRVQPAGLSPDGSPPVPDEQHAMQAAWYSGGPAPGERGAALLVGHLDTDDGPAAFAGLGSLRPGAAVRVTREDGVTARFIVDSVEQHPKSSFPSERVYGRTRSPQLRLITCGGRYTKSDGYDSNIVVFAHLTGTG